MDTPLTPWLRQEIIRADIRLARNLTWGILGATVVGVILFSVIGMPLGIVIALLIGTIGMESQVRRVGRLEVELAVAVLEDMG